MELRGLKAFDAAVYCASLTAAERRRQRKKGSSSSGGTANSSSSSRGLRQPTQRASEPTNVLQSLDSIERNSGITTTSSSTRVGQEAPSMERSFSTNMPNASSLPLGVAAAVPGAEATAGAGSSSVTAATLAHSIRSSRSSRSRSIDITAPPPAATNSAPVPPPTTATTTSSSSSSIPQLPEVVSSSESYAGNLSDKATSRLQGIARKVRGSSSRSSHGGSEGGSVSKPCSTSSISVSPCSGSSSVDSCSRGGSGLTPSSSSLSPCSWSSSSSTLNPCSSSSSSSSSSVSRCTHSSSIGGSVVDVAGYGTDAAVGTEVTMGDSHPSAAAAAAACASRFQSSSRTTAAAGAGVGGSGTAPGPGPMPKATAAAAAAAAACWWSSPTLPLSQGGTSTEVTAAAAPLDLEHDSALLRPGDSEALAALSCLHAQKRLSSAGGSNSRGDNDNFIRAEPTGAGGDEPSSSSRSCSSNSGSSVHGSSSVSSRSSSSMDSGHSFTSRWRIRSRHSMYSFLSKCRSKRKSKSRDHSPLRAQHTQPQVNTEASSSSSSSNKGTVKWSANRGSGTLPARLFGQMKAVVGKLGLRLRQDMD